MKTVLMLYPIIPFVEGDLFCANTIRLFEIEFFYSQFPFLSKDICRQRFSLINRLLDVYREDNFKVVWAYFGEDRPDITQHHEIYKVKENDLQISVGVSYQQHVNWLMYPNERNVLSHLGRIESLVVGGFHRSDCVGRFVSAGRSWGIESVTDRFLTEDFFYEIVESFGQDLFAYMIKNGTLDPKMHEDDPEEEKRSLFDFRLRNYL